MIALNSSSRKSLGLRERSHPITSKKLRHFAFGGPRPTPSKPGGRTASIARLVCHATLGGLSGFGLVSPAAASTKTWKAGTDGYYTAGANWLGGVAPVPGDTAIIISSTPWFTDAEATHGDTIVQQTLDFQANSGIPLVSILGQTTFAANTTLNFIGGVQALWGTVLKCYSNNALNGGINIGSATTSARLTLNVLDYRWGLHYTPTTSNNGTIAIAGGSVLHLYPSAGGAVVTFGPNGQISGYEWSTDLGHADFANNGLISLAPGAFLQDSWVTAGSGLYYSTLINNGPSGSKEPRAS